MVELEMPDHYTRASVVAFVSSSNNLISIYSGLKQMIDTVSIQLEMLQVELDIDYLQTSTSSFQSSPERAKLLSKQNKLTDLAAQKSKIETREMSAALDLARFLLEKTYEEAQSVLNRFQFKEFDRLKEDHFTATLLTAYLKLNGSNTSGLKPSEPEDLLTFNVENFFDSLKLPYPPNNSPTSTGMVVYKNWCEIDPQKILSHIKIGD